jgi:predicted dehydrogenase
MAQALEAGPRAIFLEKPLTPRLVDARRMVEEAEARGVALAVNYTRRWAPDVQELAAELAAGTWGSVRGATACYTKGVLNNGSHLLDLLHMLLGPVRVAAAGAPRVDHDPDDPSIPCLLVAGDEVPVAVTVGHASDYALFELRLVTERGAIGMEGGGLGWRIMRCVDSPSFPGYRALDAGDVKPGRYQEAMLAAMTGLRQHLLEGRPLACTGRDALAAQAVSHAIRTAAGLAGG